MNVGNAPVYVKIEEYKDVLHVLGLIKTKLNEAKNTINKINELKNEENAELEVWNVTLDEIEKRTDQIDRILFEPESV